MNDFRKWIRLVEGDETYPEFQSQAGGHHLYRGIEASVAHLVIDTAVQKEITNASLHDESYALYNQFLQNRFSMNLATSHHFTGRREMAAHFGTVYTCYPRDGFRFVWSTAVPDQGNAMDEFHIAVTKEFLGDKARGMSPDAIDAQMGRWLDFGPTGFHQRAMQMFMDRYGNTYTDQHLAAALASGHEILLSGKYTAMRD
jgi:hypothetical protein